MLALSGLFTAVDAKVVALLTLALEDDVGGGGGGVKDLGFDATPPFVCLSPLVPLELLLLLFTFSPTHDDALFEFNFTLPPAPPPPHLLCFEFGVGDFFPVVADSPVPALLGDDGPLASTPFVAPPLFCTWDWAGGGTISSFPSGFLGVPLLVLFIFIFSPFSESESFTGDSVTVWLPPPTVIFAEFGLTAAEDELVGDDGAVVFVAAAEATEEQIDIAADDDTVAGAVAAGGVDADEEAALSMSASRSMMRLPTSTAGQFSSSSNSLSSKFLLLLFLPTMADLATAAAVVAVIGLFLLAGGGVAGDDGADVAFFVVVVEEVVVKLVAGRVVAVAAASCIGNREVEEVDDVCWEEEYPRLTYIIRSGQQLFPYYKNLPLCVLSNGTTTPSDRKFNPFFYLPEAL